MTNKQIARILKETGALIEITGGNSFRSRAFENAARTIERMEEPATSLLDDGRLTGVKGIGTGIAGDIRQIVTRGSFTLREELLQQIPAGVLEMLSVKGVGAKKVRQLWQSLEITSLEELEAAAMTGRLATLDGFGAKTQEKILNEIRLLKQYRGQRRFADAYTLALPVLQALEAADGVAEVALTGAMRRRMETVREVEIAVSTDQSDSVERVLRKLLDTDIAADENVLTGQFPDGLPLRVHTAPANSFGTLLWRTTGSDAHVSAFESNYTPPAEHADEETIYQSVGLAFVAPELREGTGELEAAAAGALPRLVENEDLKGSLHNHSTYSDGAHTLEQMVEHARSMGLSYYGVCDHSRSLQIANGLSVERVREQLAEIRQLNDRYAAMDGPRFRIFSGTESDILADGSLDYPDDVLSSFDLIVASIHTGFNMAEDEATERLIRAIENPYTTILGHATGRLVLGREGYPINHERVIQACAENGVAIELNANPWRLDMDWRWLREATRRGVLISINPDAHSMQELENTYWGVQVARKGWLTPEQCLNAKTLEAFEEWLESRRTVRKR